MDNIKVTFNIALPGRVMYEESVCQSDKSKYNHCTISLEHTYRKGKKLTIKKEPFHFNVRKSIPAVQCINLNEDTYNYMVSKEVPSFSNKSTWNKMSKKLRLNAHLEEIAQSLGGTLLEFTVYDD